MPAEHYDVEVEIDGKPVQLRDSDYPQKWPGTKEEWLNEVARVSREVANIQFYLGDLLNQGIKTFGKAAAYSMALAGSPAKETETLRFYAWVARQVEPCRRRIPELTFNHHRAVANLMPHAQVVVLDRAVKEGLTVREVLGMNQCVRANPQVLNIKSPQKTVHCMLPESIYRDLEGLAIGYKVKLERLVARALYLFVCEQNRHAAEEARSLGEEEAATLLEAEVASEEAAVAAWDASEAPNEFDTAVARATDEAGR